VEEQAAVARIEQEQTDERITELYERLKDMPKVCWKESIKEVVGLPLATAAEAATPSV
jgi:hypothetical protein